MEYARLELKRDPEFRQFCDAHLPSLRLALPDLPQSISDCLGVEIAPGMPLAKMLLEAYNAQASEQQWHRAQRDAGPRIRGW